MVLKKLLIFTFFAAGAIFIGFGVMGCNSTAKIDYVVFEEIVYPSDNQPDTAVIALGKELFFDTRLSLDESVSCATCHKPGLAFTDGIPFSDGVQDRKSTRNATTLLNIAYSPKLMFDTEIPSLEMQALVPIQDHNEMGMEIKTLIQKLAAIPEYQAFAKRVFNRDFDAYVLTRSLAAYQRTFISNNSPFDQYYYGKKKWAISPSAKRGWKLFSEELKCTQCHALPYFTNYSAQNNGMTTDYLSDPGRFRVTKDSNDIGKFKVPTLRNIALTDPYFHNGSVDYLEDVLELYAKGGSKHRNQHPAIKPFQMTAKDRKDLVNFLFSLTDDSFMDRL